MIAIASSEPQTFDHVEHLLSRTAGQHINFSSMEDKQCWFTIDLGAWIVPSAYSIQYTRPLGNSIRNWHLYVSKDALEWLDVGTSRDIDVTPVMYPMSRAGAVPSEPSAFPPLPADAASSLTPFHANVAPFSSLAAMLGRPPPAVPPVSYSNSVVYTWRLRQSETFSAEPLGWRFVRLCYAPATPPYSSHKLNFCISGFEIYGKVNGACDYVGRPIHNIRVHTQYTNTRNLKREYLSSSLTLNFLIGKLLSLVILDSFCIKSFSLLLQVYLKVFFQIFQYHIVRLTISLTTVYYYSVHSQLCFSLFV